MPQLDVTVSFPLAFLAGVLSFLSPCVLPVVPGYITFVTGATLNELTEENAPATRRRAVLHSLAFGVGFGLVFMTLGATATALGQSFARSLPTITKLGGVVVIVFGLFLFGVGRHLPGLRALSRERRFHPDQDSWVGRAGLLGSLVVGIAFGAGWTPCIGPVLASILLFAGLQGTVLHGTLLLATYGLGLAVPFIASAVAFNWFLTSLDGVRRHLGLIEKVAGTLLLVVGIMMVTGQFEILNATLADMGQLINLESP